MIATMTRTRRSLPLVISLLALVIAISQTSYAADAARLITGKQIKDGSIGIKDLSGATVKQLSPTLPFGTSVGSAGSDATDCGGATLNTLTVKIARPARLFVSAFTSYSQGSSGLDGGSVQVAIYRGTNPNPLGTTQIGDADVPDAATYVQLTASGVLTVEDGNFATPLVLKPGTYQLKEKGAGTGSCSGVSHFRDSSLGYIVLGTR